MDRLLNLKDVTLVCVTSIDIHLAISALLISSEFCEFGSIKLLSPAKPAALPSSIEHIKIPAIDFAGYSKFMIEDLNDFVDTRYCLVIQADGFLINPSMWTSQFMQYDYIGAPWTDMVSVQNSSIKKFHFDKNRVGNGGFSLRSKKLLEACSQINFGELNFPIKSEDMIICHFLYDEMIKAGIKFAPVDVASHFSIESIISGQNANLTTTFGFHGKHWLANNYLQDLALNSAFSKEYLALLTARRPMVALEASGIEKRPNRLDPCPCGSLSRFKDCHGKLT